MASLYQQTIPVCIKYLQNLSALLDKAVKFADEKGMKHDELLHFRLVEDMRPLTYQVQSCCNTAKFMLSRLCGKPDTHFEDDETSFPQLQDRITKTIELLRTVDEQDMAGKEHEPVLMATKSMGTYKFTGVAYVVEYSMPFFHFHLSSAYCILRHLGVPLSAFDYLGRDTFVRVDDSAQQ